MPQCKAAGCINKEGKSFNADGTEKSFFVFPNPQKSEENRQLCLKWLFNLKNDQLPQRVEDFHWGKTNVVCEDHFTSESFAELFVNEAAASLNFHQRFKYLKEDAVPTILDPTNSNTGTSCGDDAARSHGSQEINERHGHGPQLHTLNPPTWSYESPAYYHRMDPHHPQPTYHHREPQPTYLHREPQPNYHHREPQPTYHHMKPAYANTDGFNPWANHGSFKAPMPQQSDKSDGVTLADFIMSATGIKIEQHEIEAFNIDRNNDAALNAVQSSGAPTDVTGAEPQYATLDAASAVAVPSKEKLYRCPECPKAFARPGDLKIHFRKHSGEKPYQCPECPAAFTMSSHLKEHRRTHSAEKPFTCSQCPAVFKRQCHLKQHFRSHSGEKPFTCGECRATFAQLSHLKRHAVRHTQIKPFKCTYCPAAFSLKQYLIEHTRTHTGEKPYQCKHCPSAFARPYALTLHTRMHTQEKHYKCPECSEAFLWKEQLKNHVRRHEKERELERKTKRSRAIKPRAAKKTKTKKNSKKKGKGKGKKK